LDEDGENAKEFSEHVEGDDSVTMMNNTIAN
jgi:hypothetical protein